MEQNQHLIPDHTLRSTILSKFAADRRIAFANLRVGVSNGVVHLAGTVASIEVYVAVAELAAGVPGVRGVVNRIEAPGAPSPARTIHLPSLNKEEPTTDDEIPE